MQIVSWLNEFNITIIEQKDSEIMLGYTNESPHWTFLNHIVIVDKQVCCGVLIEPVFVETQYVLANMNLHVVFKQ